MAYRPHEPDDVGLVGGKVNVWHRYKLRIIAGASLLLLTMIAIIAGAIATDDRMSNRDNRSSQILSDDDGQNFTDTGRSDDYLRQNFTNTTFDD